MGVEGRSQGDHSGLTGQGRADLVRRAVGRLLDGGAVSLSRRGLVGLSEPDVPVKKVLWAVVPGEMLMASVLLAVARGPAEEQTDWEASQS